VRIAPQWLFYRGGVFSEKTPTFVQNLIDMIQLTLRIRESNYALFLQFLRSLTYVEVEKATQIAEPQPDEHQKMIDYILSYQNDTPSFGDAAEWQRLERADRELPFN
jgi:hypothetical protein